MTVDEREAFGKCIEYRKDCMDRWDASFTMGDGYVVSMVFSKGVMNAKKRIKEDLLDRVAIVHDEDGHPYPHPIKLKK